MKSIHRLAALWIIGLGSASGLASAAEPPAVLAINAPTASRPAVDNRWDDSFAAFAAADKLKAPAQGGVLFVGSSSIRMWNDLESDFRSFPIIKRGFGGSRMLDCTEHLQNLVMPYKPKLVLVYAGDNDLAEGRSPQDVLKSFAAFVEGVRVTLPATRIAYISIKPSPSRRQLLPEIRQTNELIRQYTTQAENADFIDVFTPMLTDAGALRPELFREDELHMNATGYALWRKIISAHLN